MHTPTEIGKESSAGYLMEKRTRDRPRLRWTDYISNLAVEPTLHRTLRGCCRTARCCNICWGRCPHDSL